MKLIPRQLITAGLVLGLLGPVLAQETRTPTPDGQAPAGELRTEPPTSNNPAIQQSGEASTAGGVDSSGHAAASTIHNPSSTPQQPNQTAVTGEAAPTNQAALSAIHHPSSTIHQPNQAVPGMDFSAFKIIAERNIFDPNREAHEQRPPPPPAPKVIESFALVGVISYFRGTFALFDGTEPQYRKGLKVNDRIAGYTVAAITPNSVKLASEGKEVELRIGMQLRREEHGPWVVGTHAASYASSSSSASSMSASHSDPAPRAHSAGNEKRESILERLKQRREKEEKGK